MSRAGRSRQPTAGLAVAVACTLAIGCGSSEKTFTAEGFVDAANAEGAGLVLGDPLQSSRQDIDVYGVTFAATGVTGQGPAAEDSGGSLLVAADAESALGEYDRCQSSASGFLCFRIANVVVILESAVAPEDVARLTVAAKAMQAG